MGTPLDTRTDPTAADARRRELAKIAIGRKQLGMAEEVYRALLRKIGGVDSASDLDQAGRRKLLDHLRACGWRPTAGKTPHPGRPHNMASPERGALLGKVEALLADAGRPWAYADGLAMSMFGIERTAFCDSGRLHKMVAALEIDKKRRAKRQEPA